jgi:hypothetical protein
MKKILPLLVIGILILSSLGAVAISVNNFKNKIRTCLFDDELDQFQTEMTENKALPVGQIPIPDNITNVQIAQSFIPTKEILMRVELFIGKNSTATYPYILTIRTNLTGEDLTLTSVAPGHIPTEDFDWVEFDFDDIVVTTGQTYYIVSYTENTTENWYAWGANNKSDSYPFGCAWYSIDDGETWSNKSTESSSSNTEEWIIQGTQSRLGDVHTWDMCFKTYGRDNQPPNAPTITGRLKGNAGKEYEYTFNALDPNGDNVKYHIDWDDGDSDETGLNPSGEDVKVKHTWDNDGTYTIRAYAEDEFGLVGPEATLTVTITKGKNRAITSPFQWFLQQHPYLFPILQKILLQR